MMTDKEIDEGIQVLDKHQRVYYRRFPQTERAKENALSSIRIAEELKALRLLGGQPNASKQ